MPKYQIEVTEVKEGGGCGTLIGIAIVVFILMALAGK